MAHHKAALKSIRQDEKRVARNRARKDAVRISIKKLEKAITEGNKAGAKDALKAAQSHLAKAAAKKTIKAGTAARKVSRLSARVKAIA